MLCFSCKKRQAIKQGRCDYCLTFSDKSYDTAYEASQRPILETDDLALEVDMKWRDAARESHMRIVRSKGRPYRSLD